jgi:sec-independent protein translocase protein TatB
MELLVVGIVALIVVGPKDLPGLFRSVGKFVGKMKGMAREFQRSMDAAARDAGVDEALDGVKSAAGGLKKATSFNPVDFNKDLKSMAKDAVSKNTLLDDEAKAARMAKIDAEVDPTAEATPAKKPASPKASGKKPAAKKPAAHKTPARKDA